MNYKVICAWCGIYIRGDKNATAISHGICGDCLKRQLAGIPTRRPLPPAEEATTRKALTLAMGDVGRVDGLDWLSSRGRDRVDLQEVCG